MSNNMFLKFEGGPVKIEGETKDSDHLTEVDIESFSWGAYHSASFRARHRRQHPGCFGD